jgi:integrase
MLSKNINKYIELHRSLGFKFKTQGILLRNFASFTDQRREKFVTVQSVLEWASLAPSPQQRRNRLLTVRRFALMMNSENSRHQIPPANVFGNLSFKRVSPYIYTNDDINKLLMVAKALSPQGTIRPIAYYTLIALISSTGMRISEALALKLGDITCDGLVIRKTKFQKSRLIPIHQTTRDALCCYLKKRKHFGALDDSVFISLLGTAMNYNTVNPVFRELTRTAGLRNEHKQPRMHDLRHTFAVRSLEQCEATPQAVKKHIVALSTYLGHAHVTDTYWYLQATSSLMKHIAEVGEKLHKGGDVI